MKRPDIALLAALFAFALLLRVGIAAAYGFEGLYGQDAYAYYNFAASMAQGHAPGIFFWGLGYPALLTTGFWLFGTSAAVAQAISIVLGALLSPLVYVLTRQMGSGRIGAFVAGVLMAICGQALQSSLVVMADIPALAWVTISALCLWRYVQIMGVGAQRAAPLHSATLLILCSVTLALAGVTRWLCLIFVPVWGLMLLPHLRQRAVWRDILLAGLATLLVFIPQILYSTTNPYPTLNHPWVEGWQPTNAFQNAFANADGYFTYERINAVYYAQVYADPYYLAPMWTPFVLFGFALLLHQRQYRKLILLAGWALLPYLFLIGIPYQNIRFPLIVFPAVATLAGLGLDGAFSVLQHLIQRQNVTVRKSQRAARIRLVFIVGVLLIAGGIGLWESFILTRSNIHSFITNQQSDRGVVSWAVERIPEGARVYTFGITLTLRHYSTFEVNDLYNETPQLLATEWIPGEEDYLLINGWNVVNQWEGRAPHIAYRWLRTQRGLVEIGRNGYYTLYRVVG